MEEELLVEILMDVLRMEKGKEEVGDGRIQVVSVAKR